MHKNFEKLKDSVDAIMRSMFAGYHYVFDEDPEDSSVIYVNLYDVDPQDVQNFKKIIRNNIRDVFRDENILFVPAIFTTEETRKCYGEEFLKVNKIALVDEVDLSLHDELLRQLEDVLNNIDYTIEVKCDSINTDLPRAEMSQYEIQLINRVEDGGCGYAGEKCRLAA